jgi:hypothetical protein
MRVAGLRFLTAARSSSRIMPHSSSSSAPASRSTSAMAGSWKTKRTLPIRILAPWVSCASVIISPLTRVPFVEPRSRRV